MRKRSNTLSALENALNRIMTCPDSRGSCPTQRSRLQSNGRSTVTSSLGDKEVKRTGETTSSILRDDEASILTWSPTESLLMRESKTNNAVDVNGVRIRPAVVSFPNTFENQSYIETVSIQNISDNSLTVRIHNPRAWSFRVNPLDRGYQLAPGLKIIRRVHYTCMKGGIKQCKLPIYINNNLFELPLEASKGLAFVEIIPTTVKFGRVDIDCKPVVKKILIKNISYCATKFMVDVGSNDLDLLVGPLKGWIRPYNSVTIVLQLMALREGTQSTELWITTDISQHRVQVEVEACRRSFMVLHPNTISDFTLIDFPNTFYGCSRYQTVVVYNMAASSSAFVVLADFGKDGQLPFREAKEEHNVRMFDIEPVEGRINPFEERIFTIWFNPKIFEDNDKTGWKSDNDGNLNDYLCGVRIKRIQVDDVTTEENPATYEAPNYDSLNEKLAMHTERDQSMSNGDADLDKEHEVERVHTDKLLLEEISVLLYLYGEAEVPTLSVDPDLLRFRTVPVGNTVVKVVQITNSTNRMLAFQYSKIPFFEVFPDFKKLAPKSSCDLTVKLKAKNIGTLRRNLIIEVLAMRNATDKQDFQVVSQVTVKISGEVKSQKTVPQPKFNPGITPLIAHEVGFLTDEVTFASKIDKPRCAMTAAVKYGRPWHQTEAIIAFPNDRPLTLRPRPTDATAKTIFKGLPRYIAPVDESITYTIENLIRKKAHEDGFLNYIRGTAAMSIPKDKCCKWKNPVAEPDAPLVPCQEKEEKLPHKVLAPLTLVQLYRIRVFPSLISFGSVTTCKTCTQLLNIENGNNFKISAWIVPLTTGINIQTPQNFIIPENSDAKVVLTFQRETLGRYSGTITCIINGFHSFDIGIVAEVVNRSLAVTPENLEIKVPEVPFAKTFAPIAINNPLNIPITFSWDVPDESPIKIEPIVGVTPKRGTVWCVVFFEPDSPNYKLHPIKLMVEGTICLKLQTGVTLPKTNVYFLEPTLNVGYIPMNLTTVRRFIMFNPDFSDAMFVVLNKDPVKGIKVIPSSGTIRAKCCYCLALHITVPVEKALEFTLFVNLQNSATIEMRVVGNVVYPKVLITPQYINLHRIPCNSAIRTYLMAENQSKAKAEVSFKMDEYPQFKVSLSKKHHDNALSGFTLEPGAMCKFYLHFIPKDLASYAFYLPVVVNNLTTRRSSSDKDMESQERIIKTSSRGSTRDRRGSSGAVPVMSHLVLIDVVVLKAALIISDLELFFSVSETKIFSVKNVSDQALSIIIRSEDYPSYFDCQIDKVVFKDRCSLRLQVEPGESVTYLAAYTVTTPGVHVNDICILTSFEDHSMTYNTVRLTGYIPLPCVISSSVKQVYFQPVTLNVDTSFVFRLKISHNEANKATQISYEISHPHADLFIVEFPKGNIVAGVTTSTMPVKITFRSSFPLSLRKKITFRGDKQGECSVKLIATADNSLLTAHAYFNAHFPYKPRLRQFDEVCEKFPSIPNEKTCHRKQQLVRLHSGQSHMTQATHSSESTKSKSLVSLNTIETSRGSSKFRKSFYYSKDVEHPRLLGQDKERPTVSYSDMELSLQLSDKDERSPSKEESITIAEIIAKEEEELKFPMFPTEKSVCENADHMEKTKLAVQQWVYEQVFCCSYNPIFGSHQFSSFNLMSKKEYGSIAPVATRNVFDALERICGRRIRRYFTPIDKLPEEPTAKAMFTYNLYRQLIDFMEAQGALMAHVEPKYLMVYEEYCLYQRGTPVTDKFHELTSTGTQFYDDNVPPELLNAEKFNSISVQCWLDLFLQMFKTLVLGPTVGITYYVPLSSTLLTPRYELSKRAVQDSVAKSIYGKAEEVLMTWLTHQFNTQRTVVWPTKSPPARTVTNFDMDLEDGLVLTATTAAYCPYLSELHFHHMCLNPTTISQAYHNTICLCMAWDSIKLGYSVTPRDFVHPNTINMLLLVTHLYKVLPSYKPEAKLTFRATLNANESQVVMLENDEEVSVTYHVEILPQSANFFLEDCDNPFVLKRKSKGKISVGYMARSTNKAEATLLLCGACMPPKFGQNYVFTLEGYPVRLPVCSSFNIVAPQNTPLDTEITVESPHHLDFKASDSYSYDLWIAYTEPQPGNLNAMIWSKERMRKIPRRLYFFSNTLVVRANKKKRGGEGVVDFKVCCFSQIVCNIWLIFSNPEIGDFIVKLQVSPQKPNSVLSLEASVEQHSKCSCTGERTSNCNRCATVNIPCRNLEQWSAIRTMFELSTTPAEKEFWSTHIESNVGFRLLQWMLEEKRVKLNEELEILFKKCKTYKVTCPSKYVTCMPTICIPDVRSKSSLPIELHLDEGIPEHSTVLNMTSLDGHEMRSYNLKVVSSRTKSKSIMYS